MVVLILKNILQLSYSAIGLCTYKTGLGSPAPALVIYYWHSEAVLLLWFILSSMFARFMFAFDFLYILFRIAW